MVLCACTRYSESDLRMLGIFVGPFPLVVAHIEEERLSSNQNSTHPYLVNLRLTEKGTYQGQVFFFFFFFFLFYFVFLSISKKKISLAVHQNNYSRLSLSRIPRESLKYFDISVLRHIRFAELRKNLFD